MTQFSFEIHGTEAESVAKAFAAAIKDELNIEVAPQPSSGAETGAQQRSVESVATLILAIPPAALATWELVDRVKAILDKRKALKSEHPDTEISIIAPDGSTLDVEPEEASKVVEAAIDSES